MKMTMHINEDLLNRVIELYGYESKTEAVDAALRELDRRARYRTVVAAGLGFSPEELMAGVEEGYDVLASRAVAESRGAFGSKGRRKKSR